MEKEPLNLGSPQASLNVGSHFFLANQFFVSIYPTLEPRVLLVLVFLKLQGLERLCNSQLML